MIDLVTKTKGTNTGSVANTRSNFIGNTVNTDTAAVIINWTGRQTPTYDRWVYAALFKPTTNINSAKDILQEEISGTSSTGLTFNSNTNVFTLRKGGINFSLTATVGGVGDVFFVAAGGSYSAQNKFSIVVRCLSQGNKIDTAVGSFSTFPPVASGGFKIGNAGSGNFPGQIGWTLFSYDAVTLNELIAWARDPDSIFAEDGDDWTPLYSQAGGGGGDVTVAATGVSATGSVGNIGTDNLFTVPITGVSATGSVGSVATGQGVTGVTGTGSVGNVGPQITVGVTGVSATGQVGNVDIAGDKTVAVTGVQATGQVGNVTVDSGTVIQDSHDPGLRKRRKKLEEARQKQFEAEREKRAAHRATVFEAYEHIVDGKLPVPDVVREEIVTAVEAAPETQEQRFDFPALLHAAEKVQALWDQYLEQDDEDVLVLL